MYIWVQYNSTLGEREVEHKTSNASLGMEFKLRTECEEKAEGAQREGEKVKGKYSLF